MTSGPRDDAAAGQSDTPVAERAGAEPDGLADAGRTATRQRLARIARFACLLVAAYFGAIAAFALLNAEQFASAMPQLIRYVLAPGAIAAILILIALFARPGLTGMVAGSALSILAGLFLFETMVTLRNYSAVAGLVSMPDADWMRQADVDRGLPPSRTAKGLNAVLEVKDLNQAILGGIPNESVLLCTQGGQPIIYRADRYGFNNPDNLYDEPIDLVVLGDSFVEGICLPSDRNLIGQIRKAVPRTIGLGHRGAGPLMELAMLGRFGKIVQPKLVVMVYFAGNDWENLDKELQVPNLTQALRPGQDFGSPEPESDMLKRAEKPIADWIENDRADLMEVVQRRQSLRNFLALSNTSLALGLAYPKVAHEQPKYQRVLERARTITESWGGTLVLFYVPNSDRYQGLLQRDFVYDQGRSKVLDAARKTGVPVIDFVDLARTQRNPEELYNPAEGHFSEAGAQLAGQAVIQWVRGNDRLRSMVGPAPPRPNLAKR